MLRQAVLLRDAPESLLFEHFAQPTYKSTIRCPIIRSWMPKLQRSSPPWKSSLSTSPFNHPLSRHHPPLMTCCSLVPLSSTHWCSSSPPSLATATFQLIALPGSPLHWCISCALRRFTTGTPQESGEIMPAEDSCKDLDTPAPCERSKRQSEIAAAAAAGRGGAMARRAIAAEIFFAACVGSLLDLDHFLAAGSLRLSRATGLDGRPWGHSVAALVVAVRDTELNCRRIPCTISSVRRFLVFPERKMNPSTYIVACEAGVSFNRAALTSSTFIVVDGMHGADLQETRQGSPPASMSLPRHTKRELAA